MQRHGLYERFAASVRSQPDATALELPGDRFSYAELDRSAGRVARLTREATSRPQRVGILAARSLTAYAGYLAALRAGAAVVPLNPTFPPARNAQICLAAGIDVVIADVDVPADLPDRIPVVDLRGEAGDRLLRGRGLGADDKPADPNHLAYVLFTSGSTGVPKGVPITQASIAGYLNFCAERYRPRPGDRFSQTFDLTFDPSVQDMFVAWSSGAALVVPRKDELMSPVDLINRAGITHWFSVPWYAAMAERLGQLTEAAMPTLRWSLFGGDRLTIAEAEAWRRAAPHSVLENLYGPTEVTIAATGYRLPDDRRRWPVTANGTLPIGRVFPHLAGMVMDDQGRPGDEGELYLRGPQRFNGYLDPAQNAGRFAAGKGEGIEDHDGPPGPGHWYRTGDLVRVDRGELVHLGRLDQQVKINGSRIELGEIEALLRADEHVDDVVVLTVPSRRGGTEIVAAVVGGTACPADLTAALRARLPRYMVPARVLRLSALPLNHSQKIDRKQVASAFA
jgi:amino acid adenylation domain-containing protein